MALCSYGLYSYGLYSYVKHTSERMARAGDFLVAAAEDVVGEAAAISLWPI